MNDAARLQELLDTVLSGSYTDAQSEELRQLLDRSPELRNDVFEQLRTHSLLQWRLAPSVLTTDSLPLSDSFEDQEMSAEPGSVVRRVSARRGIIAAFAATLLVAIGYIWYGQQPTLSTPVGKLIRSESLRLTSASSELFQGDQFIPGTIEIESGTLGIELASGVEVEIGGPARCEVVSTMLLKLEHGQATAQVPRWARGFKIETPDVGVVDLGTKFGVAKRDNDKTDVVVFEGEVDLKSLVASEKTFERRLTQGEAARIDRRGEIERIFQVHGESTGNGWTTHRAFSEGALIEAVWDNLGATKSVSYYQVIAAGLAEDAPAYVDHPHQWNGVDTTGLPDFLAGADYVRMVNDYRYLGELTIQIEFAEDAELYVFFDNRVAAPEWLRDRFQDTGFDVGLDEDAWFGNSDFTVASGAGESIDNTFSIWRRPCNHGEVFTLGAVGEGREARAMYGIAASRR